MIDTCQECRKNCQITETVHQINTESSESSNTESPSSFTELLSMLSILLPVTCGYVTLHGKGEFADGIKDLEVGRLLWTELKA